MKLGVTGNIGSGKSTFCRFAEDAGYTVLRADEISKLILEQDPAVIKAVIKEFGERSYRNGKPDKYFLADKIFSDPARLQKLESILHPRVIKKIKQQIDKAETKEKAVFIEAALIYESDIENLFDFVVLITSEFVLRMERKIDSGMKEEDFIKRDSNQIPEDEKKKRADFIFSNNSTVEELQAKFRLLQLTLGL